MASNSEANSSDFDIDEVINWDEHNYSSKDIEFQLPPLGLPNDVKTSQNTTANHPSLPSPTASSQQTTLSVTQNTNQSLYATLFGAPSSASTIRNSKSHGFPTHETMVSQLAPSFPSESLDIPPITPPSSNTSLLQFSSNIVPVQNASVANQIHVQQMQSVQHTPSMLSESVSPFTDDAMMDGSDDFIEGPLDKIVAQIMDRQLNEAIMKTSALSNTYGHHPVVTCTNNSMQNLIISPSVSSVQSSTSSNVTIPLPTIQNSTIQTVQKNIPTHSQSKFTLQSPGSNIVTSLGQTSVVRMPRNNMQQKAVSLQSTTNIEELLNMQKSVGSAVTIPKVEQNQFRNQLTKPVPTSSLISSTPSSGRPTNTRISAENKSMCVSLVNTSMLQANRTNSPNSELNRTKNTVPQKLAFVPSVSSSAPKNVSSQVISSQGLNIQRSLSLQGTRNPATVQATTSQNISSVGNQTGVKSMQVSASLLNQSTNNLQSLLMSQSQISSTKPNLAQLNIPRSTSRLPSNFPIFTIANTPNVSLPQSTTQKPTVVTVPECTPSPSGTSSISNQTNPTGGAGQSIATTTLKITSPSPNIASGFQQPITRLVSNISSLHTILNKTSPHLSTPSTQGPKVSSLHTILNKTSPRLSTSSTVPPVTSNTRVFSNYQLNQAIGSGSNTSKSSMVFTLAPGLQGPATLKALPITGKDKFTGRQIFLLQQPGQVIDKSKPQQVKIIFVNDGSVRQVVSGPQKFNEASSSSPAIVSSQSQPAVQVVTPKATFTSPASTVNTVQVVASPVPDTSEGSPSSVNSGDSDNLPITVLKQTPALKTKEEQVGVNKRGTKRKKDPNKPVKPLSSFQRFFQKTQATIRQQDPNAPFADVSKIAKQMWENLEAKEKKVYQEAWRTERVQYKKALEEYNASCLNESEVDGPSPKQLKNGQSSTSPVPVSPIGVPHSGMVHSLVSSPTVSVPPASLPSISASPVSLPLVSVPPVSLPPGFVAPVPSVSLSSQPVSSSTGGTSNTGMAAPRGGGKPLAMMVELANKTKMASGQVSGKTPGTAKWSKTKGSSNGVDDGLTYNIQITKKKPKINPIPKKLCVRESCNKTAKTTKERGTLFCSNECIMMHCRGIFKIWVEARRGSLKAAS